MGRTNFDFRTGPEGRALAKRQRGCGIRVAAGQPPLVDGMHHEHPRDNRVIETDDDVVAYVSDLCADIAAAQFSASR
jgi:hypothetical protein